MSYCRLVVLGAVLAAAGAVAPARALQVPTETAQYTVAYVDVVSSATAVMREALTRYRESSRQEAGYLYIDLLEQVGRPNRYAVVEAWADQGSLDAHGAAAHTTMFREQIQSIRLTGYDQRPYQAFSVASARGDGGAGALRVVTHVDIGGPQPDAPELLRSLAEASRMEAGCLRFDILQHTMRGNHFTIVEVWRDQEAFDQHGAAPHTKAYRQRVQPMTGSPLDERVYMAVG